MSDKLPMGRIAFAKSVCLEWIVEYSRTILSTLAAMVILSFGFFQWIGPTLQHKKMASLIPPYYAEFSKTTATIRKGNWTEALAAARNLQKQMRDDTVFWESQDKMIRSGDLLYAYNLMRIAALEKEVGTPIGELAALDEFLSHMTQPEVADLAQMKGAEAWALVGYTFQDGAISLQDYIQQRKNSLEITY